MFGTLSGDNWGLARTHRTVADDGIKLNFFGSTIKAFPLYFKYITESKIDQFCDIYHIWHNFLAWLKLLEESVEQIIVLLLIPFKHFVSGGWRVGGSLATVSPWPLWTFLLTPQAPTLIKLLCLWLIHSEGCRRVQRVFRLVPVINGVWL